MNEDSELISVLNDLLENARDGEYGFTTCAEQVASPDLKKLFDDRAQGCALAAQELEGLIIVHGGEPASGGTSAGALHRGWIQVKGAVGDDSELSILESCERGEDSGVARYRKALKEELPLDVREIVERQAAGAQKNHDLIRDMRNGARARAKP